MTDCFVLLQLPNAGDDLQAIKKGIMELADMVVFNKADIDPLAAQMAASQMRSALAMLHPATQHWKPPVLTLSAVRKDGIEKFWETIESYRATLSTSGDYAIKRRRQAQAWMWTLIDSGLRERFHAHPDVQSALKEVSCEVEVGNMTPTAAANRLLDLAQQRA